jgi:hypothetical protein
MQFEPDRYGLGSTDKIGGHSLWWAIHGHAIDAGEQFFPQDAHFHPCQMLP